MAGTRSTRSPLGLVCGAALALSIGGREGRAQSCTAPAFSLPPTAVAVGTTPRGVAVADFDRDGFLDLATADQGSNTVTVRYGAGGFTFAAAPTTLATGLNTGPLELVAGDLDRSGTIDLAVLLGTTSQVLVFKKDPAGRTFTTGQTLALPTSPLAIAAGDFDNDGDLDLATTLRSGQVQFSRNDGSAVFTNAALELITAADTLPGVAVGDFDRNGWQDAAVVDVEALQVVLLLNDKLGGWTHKAYPLASAGPTALAVADGNRDAWPDVFVASASQSVDVLLNDRAGGLATPTQYPFARPQSSIVAADFNRDGIPDVAVAENGSGQIEVALGDGTGKLSSNRVFADAANDPLRLAVGDFDRDGRPDVVGTAPVSRFAILFPNQFGQPCPLSSFRKAGRLRVPSGNGNVEAIVAGDWNADGIPDLATVNNATLNVLPGDGALNFGAPTPVALSIATSPNDRRALVSADFNLDGQPDLATVNPAGNSVTVLLNGGGTFAPSSTLAVGANPMSLVAGDWNGDGAPDIVALNRGGLSVTFLPGKGDGTFGTATTTAVGFGLGGLEALAAADFDGDLVLDLALVSSSSNVAEWLKGNGAGGFTPMSLLAVGNFPRSLDAGDLNGDGRPDIVVANMLGNTVSVLLNAGGGAFAPAVSYPVDTEPHWVRIGFANADGLPDLVVPNRVANDVTILLNGGAGSFGTSKVILGFQNPNAAVLVDADRNGKPDLAVPNWNLSGSLMVLPGDGTGGFGPDQVSPALSTGQRSVASADFDRDGIPDLVTLDSTNSKMSFLKGNGDGTFAAEVAFDTTLASPVGLGVGDFDENGTLDVIVGSSTTTSALMRGDGLGGFTATAVPSTISGSTRYRIAVADFDRDGKLDFARLAGANVAVQFGNGTGGFTTGVAVAAGGSPTDFVVLDFNRNGILDLAVTDFTLNAVRLLNGSGNRATPFTVLGASLAALSPVGISAGDFDHDGFVDLAVAQMTSASPPGPSVGYFRGALASPFFGARSDYNLGDATLNLQPDGVAAADVNADGNLDLLVACRVGGGETRASVRVLPGTGSTTPGAAFGTADVWVVAQRNPSTILVADFDRDAKPDFATAELVGVAWLNRVSVVLNSNCLPRKLRLTRDVSPCNQPLVSFPQQPAVAIQDDGTNVVRCDAGDVTPAIVPGSGSAGASLAPAGPLTPASGLADWTTAPLSIDLAGRKYRLQFSHALAGLTLTRTFSLAPSLTIAGPTAYCASVAGYFSTDLGFDWYRWYIDASPSVASFHPDITIGAGSLPPAGHTLRVDAAVDTCPATQTLPVTLFADLTAVVVTPGAPVTICASCGGPTLGVSDSGGGTATHQWGYRTVPGGTIVPFAGQTGLSLPLNGAQFPGQGTYYVVVETTPQCGAPRVSNQVEVRVTSGSTTDDVVEVLTVRSTATHNYLQWALPPGRTTVRIRYDATPPAVACVPPPTEGVGIADIPDQAFAAGGIGSFDHAGLTNNWTYCYSMFVDLGGANFTGPPRSVKGRPFDTSGYVKWAFSTGATSMAPPGLGSGVIHAVSNDNVLHSVLKGGAGGAWPSGWRPFIATGPSQGRPSTVPIGVPPASRVVYFGSQAAAGNNVLAVDADTGLGLWGQPLGVPVQAAPGGIFTAFGGAFDYILLGTRNSGGDSAFYAFDPATGSYAAPWPYTGEAGNRIGIVNSQAAADYPGQRVFFTSYQRTPGATDSVWCVQLADAQRCTGWSPHVTNALGHVAASPTLRGARLYVAPLVGVNSEIQALDAADGSAKWSPTFAPGDGQVKLFVVPDVFSNDLYLSTNATTWSIRDDGTAPFTRWSRAILSPSQPVFFAGTGRVYVGGGDGRLYVLSASDGNDLYPPITLGDGGAAVGAPTVDQAGGFVYVGTDAGVVYAVAIPTP